MKANKKVRKNSLRPVDGDVSALGVDFMGSLDLVLKFILVVLALALSSLGLIFVHDFITQSPLFRHQDHSYFRCSVPQRFCVARPGRDQDGG